MCEPKLSSFQGLLIDFEDEFGMEEDPIRCRYDYVTVSDFTGRRREGLCLWDSSWFLALLRKSTFIQSMFQLNTDNILISLAIPVSLYLVLQDHFVATPLLHSYVSLVIVRSSCSSQTVHSIMLASIYTCKWFIRVSYMIL